MSKLDFILLSSPRSGTHFVRGLLNSHPRIWCGYEVFNADHVQPKEYCVESTLHRYVYGANDLNGFALHVTHGAPDTWEANEKWGHIWEKLPAKKPKVIVLRRYNELARLVSWAVAERRGLWTAYEDMNVDEVTPFVMNIQALKDAYELHQKLWKKRLPLFEDTFPIYYEDVAQDPLGQMAKVFDYLGVGRHTVEANTPKLGIPLREQLLNYDDIRTTFRGYPFFKYIDL